VHRSSMHSQAQPREVIHARIRLGQSRSWGRRFAQAQRLDQRMIVAKFEISREEQLPVIINFGGVVGLSITSQRCESGGLSCALAAWSRAGTPTSVTTNKSATPTSMHGMSMRFLVRYVDILVSISRCSLRLAAGGSGVAVIWPRLSECVKGPPSVVDRMPGDGSESSMPPVVIASRCNSVFPGWRRAPAPPLPPDCYLADQSWLGAPWWFSFSAFPDLGVAGCLTSIHTEDPSGLAGTGPARAGAQNHLPPSKDSPLL